MRLRVHVHEDAAVRREKIILQLYAVDAITKCSELAAALPMTQQGSSTLMRDHAITYE